ncbi:unnamed protein product [Prunus armeniaca]|uniref:Uncharacterized protein n=1 Tax=Prunus armeniaca TaxID=36596 RepID=A0A6J5VXB4_PRUAR|nr:unnamed protein product [Prunus armeniaca]
MISMTPEYELPYYHDASQVTLDMVMDNDNLTHVLWNRYSYSIGMSLIALHLPLIIIVHFSIAMSTKKPNGSVMNFMTFVRDS